MKKVTIYTDGACSSNPGPGGWGAVLICGDLRKEIGGGEENTTNNRMELTAAIKALEMLRKPCIIELYSDSAYLVNAHVQKWLMSWQKNGWKRKNGSSWSPVMNDDLWKRLLELEKIHQIEWKKVNGHSGIKENEICDKIATGEAAKMAKKSEKPGA